MSELIHHFHCLSNRVKRFALVVVAERGGPDEAKVVIAVGVEPRLRFRRLLAERVVAGTVRAVAAPGAGVIGGSPAVVAWGGWHDSFWASVRRRHDPGASSASAARSAVWWRRLRCARAPA